MVSFSHLDAGTPESQWLAATGWQRCAQLDVSGIRRLVVVSAHPDDETLGAGGLIHRAAQRCAEVRMIVVTDGEGSHPNSPTHTAFELRAIRRAELLRAAHVLAPDAEIQFLSVPDGQVREHGDRVSRRIHEAVGDAGDGVVLVAPWRGDGHRDHRAAGAIARATAKRTGVRLLQYPIWMWHWAHPDDDEIRWEDMLTLELTVEERSAKGDAMAAHASQVRPLSEAPGDEVLLNAEVRSHFTRNFETFICEAAPWSGDEAHSHGPGSAGGDAPATSLPEEFFNRFYTGKVDPWGFETRWYEKRKRAITLASLPRERFASALEVGCSTGVLTAELAPRCDRLLAIDIADAPLTVARDRLRDQAGVEFAKLATPHEWPNGAFDLIVLSEVGYYWGEADLDRALSKVMLSLAPDGVLLSCHWRHPVAEYPHSGDRVHARIQERSDLVTLVTHSEEDFILGVFTRPPAISVARATGLV